MSNLVRFVYREPPRRPPVRKLNVFEAMMQCDIVRCPSAPRCPFTGMLSEQERREVARRNVGKINPECLEIPTTPAGELLRFKLTTT